VIDTGTESAGGAGRPITDRAGISTTHIHPAETIEHESVKSATPAPPTLPAPTDGTTENGIEIAARDGETTEETTDGATATCSMTDEVEGIVVAVNEIRRIVVQGKTETSSLLKHVA